MLRRQHNQAPSLSVSRNAAPEPVDDIEGQAPVLFRARCIHAHRHPGPSSIQLCRKHGSFPGNYYPSLPEFLAGELRQALDRICVSRIAPPPCIGRVPEAISVVQDEDSYGIVGD